MNDEATPGNVRLNTGLGLLPVGALTDGEVALLRAWAEDYAAECVAAERERWTDAATMAGQELAHCAERLAEGKSASNAGLGL